MFVATWSSDFFHEEPQLTTVVVPVEMRGAPYLLFNQKSLSRLSTAIGKPVSLAPETERKENFEVAKIWVKINFFEDLLVSQTVGRSTLLFLILGCRKSVLSVISSATMKITVLYMWLWD